MEVCAPFHDTGSKKQESRPSRRLNFSYRTIKSPVLLDFLVGQHCINIDVCFWWRRGESNPCPKPYPHKLLRVEFRICDFPRHNTSEQVLRLGSFISPDRSQSFDRLVPAFNLPAQKGCLNDASYPRCSNLGLTGCLN